MHGRSQSERNIILPYHKDNCVNTLNKFFKPDVDYVTKLNFYEPLGFNKSLFNVKRSSQIIPNTKVSTSDIKLPTFVSKSYQNKSELAKYLYLRRLENINYESILENKRIHLEELIRNNKKEIHKLYTELSKYKKEFEEIEIEMEYLKNYNNYSGYQNKLNIASINSKNREEDIDSMLRIKKILDVQAEKREGKINKKSHDLTQTKEHIKSTRQALHFLTEKNLKLETELDSIKKELMIHYHKIFSEGKDTRKEGLTWIIKAIWNLGFKILPSYLPPFLDEKAIAFLFSYANKDVQLSFIKKKLEDTQLFMKIKKEYQKNSSGRLSLLKTETALRKTSGTFKTDLESDGNLTDILDYDNEINKDIVRVMIENYHNENNMFEDSLNFKKIQKLLQNSGRLDEESYNYIKVVKDLEEEYKTLQLEMQEMRKKELDRLNKEFYSNDYERRFDISQKAVISAIVGEDNFAKEYVRQKREQKSYFKKIEGLRNYNKFSMNYKSPIYTYELHYEN